MTISRDRIRGLFLGVQVGDCLGMPVETFPAEDIKRLYGRIEKYLIPKDHKWFKDDPAAVYTDDTQLTIATAEAMIESPLDMDVQAAHHVKALKDGPKGWGRSTKNSIRRIANGCNWANSAEPVKEGGGAGNGIAMKIAPVAAFYANGLMKINQKYGINRDTLLDNMSKIKVDDLLPFSNTYDFIHKYTNMTHANPIALQAGFAQFGAIFSALSFSEGNYNHDWFSNTVLFETEMSQSDEMIEDPMMDNLYIRYKDMFMAFEDLTPEWIIENFSGGDCYSFNSVPFSHFFFCKNPNSIESLFDCISAGGDTDTNGSMVGALLGALNGTQIFPQYLIDELLQPNLMFDLADRFCDRFDID